METTFQKDDFISFMGKPYQAVCVDNELAIFGRIRKESDGSLTTRFDKMIALSNDPSFVDSFQFSRLTAGEI